MESRIRHGYDASLALLAVGSVAQAATFTSTKLPLDRITNSPRGAIDGKFEERNFSVVVAINALDHTTGDETYSVAFTTWDVNGANPVVHFTRLFTTADIGVPLVFDFDTGTLAAADADAAEFGFVATLAGTTPSVQGYVFVAPTA